MTRIAIAVVALLLAAVAVASPEEFGVAPAPEPAVPDEVLLTDGTVLTGRIVEMNDDVVVIVTESLGRMEIPRDRVVRTARAGDDAGVRMDPDRNTLMFCPTPETLPKGSHYFRDFELFFLNFGTAVSDDLDGFLNIGFRLFGDTHSFSLAGFRPLADSGSFIAWPMLMYSRHF